MSDEAKETTETMIHYLFEMHKDGETLLKIEMNVPCESFSAIKLLQFMSVETLMLDYGRKRGWTRSVPPAQEPAASPDAGRMATFSLPEERLNAKGGRA